MPQGDAELQDLYRETLLDYSRSGAHKGLVEKPDLRSRGINPVCGDEIELTLTLEGPAGAETISRIRYQGQGCVISQASAAMMAEALEGLKLARAGELAAAFREMMTAADPPVLPEEIEVAEALEGVRKFPIRVKCATLGWNTLLQGLSKGRVNGKAEFEEGSR